MKPWPHLVSAVGFALIGVPAECAAQAQDRLWFTPLENPGFEAPHPTLTPDGQCPDMQGDVAHGWFDNSCWTGNEATDVLYSADSTAPRSGAWSQRIALTSGVVQLAQPIRLESDRLYTASIWMRARKRTTVSLALRKADAPYTNYVLRTAELDSQWRRFTVSGFCEATDGLFILRSSTADFGNGASEFWLDDAELSAVPRRLPLKSLSNTEIPTNLFGMHMHDSDLPWPSVGALMGGVRIWDADGPLGPDQCAQWACTNPAPGVYDWEALDLHVARAIAQGAEVSYTLGRTPRWASARPDEPSSYGPGQAAEPADDQDWRDWVIAVGTRYQGLISSWEIWNEPNDAGFYSGTPTQLVSLAAQAHTILKALDPGNRIVSPSPYDLEYLDEYLALGGGQFADVIGYHFYLGEDAPEYLYESYIPNALTLLEKHGLSQRPLWNTEAGWFAPPPLPIEQGVGYLARTYLLNWAAGSPRFFFYSWDGEFDAGVTLSMPPAYVQPTPAGVAYGELSSWLVGSFASRPTRRGKLWTMELDRPNAASAHVAWNTAASIAFLVPESWEVDQVRDLAGRTLPLPANRLVPLDGRPLLFE